MILPISIGPSSLAMKIFELRSKSIMLDTLEVFAIFVIIVDSLGILLYNVV